jgi:c(7)-type cytochrome triheme protein
MTAGGPLAVVVGTAVGVGLTLAALAGPGSTAAVSELKAPPDFPMPKAETSPGQVTFSHAVHRAKVAKCSTCHMRDFKMKRGASEPVTLVAKQEGRLCGACHDGKTTMAGTVVFPVDECDRCHK